jgi:hypothetical protein
VSVLKLVVVLTQVERGEGRVLLLKDVMMPWVLLGRPNRRGILLIVDIRVVSSWSVKMGDVCSEVGRRGQRRTLMNVVEV